jgi:RPAP1-like, N-terminal.
MKIPIKNENNKTINNLSQQFIKMQRDKMKNQIDPSV